MCPNRAKLAYAHAITQKVSLENDTVSSMARVLWRKQNLATYRIAEAARRHNDRIRNEKGANPPFPEMDFGLEPADPEKLKAAEQAAEEQARKELGSNYKLIEIGKIATIPQMLDKLDVEERLDAKLDRGSAVVEAAGMVASR